MYTISENEKSQLLKNVAEELIPFNQTINVKFVSAEPVQISIENRPELVGNSLRQILHGGVIATLLDVVGGLAIMKEILDTVEFQDQAEMVEKVARSGTIDLRVDYIRPGKGDAFFATGKIIRHGKRVSVARMELVNDEGVLIALGTGTYVV